MELRPGDKPTKVGIPEDWLTASIGSVASFTSGQGINIASLTEKSSDASVPVYGGNGIAGYTTTALTREPTVVVGRVGQKCGEVYLTTGPAWITDNALYPRRFLRTIDVRFLALAMQNAGLNSVKNRNDLPLVTQSILHAVTISLPTTEAEQCAIAAALSDVDALLEGLTRLIAKKRDLKQAAMQQLLTGQTRLPGFHGEWEVKKIGELTDCTAGGTPSTLVSSYWGGAIRWMSSGELNLKLVYEVEGRITESGLHNSSAVMLPAKCVLIGLAGQGKTRGTAALNLVELCTNQSIAAILPNAAFVPEYLYYNLDSRYDELREMSTGTGGRGALNLSIIKAIDIRLPPLPEQAAIAAVLSDMDAELSALENRRDKTRAVKQAMMQELLTGRTRLVVPAVTENRKDSERTDGRQANIYFKRSVLAAEIIDRLHNEPTFGHVKFEKMIYLVEHLCDVDTGSTYHRDAAGPYDNRALRSIDSQLRKQKWFEAQKVDDRYRYEPLANRGKHKEYFERYFGGIGTTFDTVIETFRGFTTERCEIVATLFGAWRDLLQQNGPVSDDAIVNEVLNNWHKSKKRIPEERWRKALSWMRDHGFVPRKATGG